MCPRKATETSQSSEEMLKEIEAATIEDSEETEETEAATTEEEQETSEEEETETPEEKVEEEPQRYPINVKGKIEMLTLDEMRKYAQQGRFLEQERAKDREQKEQLTWEDYDKNILDKVKTQGYAKTHVEFVTDILKTQQSQLREVRKEARALADGSEWGKDPSYRERMIELVEEGITPTNAAAQISADYWEKQAKQGQQKGAEKERKKISAQVEKGREAITETTEHAAEAPTLENYEKLVANPKTSSNELLQQIVRAGGKIVKGDW